MCPPFFASSRPATLLTPLFTTAIISPGFAGSYDTHDVFLLQVEGSKKWTICGTPVELPLSGQSFDASVHELGARKLEFVLEAGDAAYVPCGVVHEAQSADEVSLHITAGVLRYTLWKRTYM